MQVIEIKDKNLWNNFVGSKRHSQFLQSWEWGEFQKSLGRKVFRLGLIESERSEFPMKPSDFIEGEQILCSALVIKNSFPFTKSYLYCPRGAIVENQGSKIKDQNDNLKFKIILEKLLARIKEIARKENSIFFRLEPPRELFTFSFPAQALGFREARAVQPQDTLILDLSKGEDELLKKMHPKTRYNIRLAEKRGVKINSKFKIQNSKLLNIFWRLLQETARRDKFRTYPKEYYKRLMEMSRPEGSERKDELFTKLYLAQYQDKILACNLVVFFGDTATYLHGATSSEYRNLMAPHFLQWEAIREAKRLGYHFYDLWGIASEEIKNQKSKIKMINQNLKIEKIHPWAGITRFKRGFGGEKIHYPGAYELIFQPVWYRIYQVVKKLR